MAMKVKEGERNVTKIYTQIFFVNIPVKYGSERNSNESFIWT